MNFGFLDGRNDGVEGGAFHAGHEFHYAGFVEIHNQAIDDFVAEVAVSHLATLEAETGFDLVAFGEEADSLILFRDVVMLVHVDGELDFLDDDDFLLLASGAIAFVFLVEELAVILDFAHRGYGVWRYFNEIEGTFSRHLEGVERSHDAELFAVLVDHADFACTDTLVGADKRLCGTLIDWWDS